MLVGSVNRGDVLQLAGGGALGLRVVGERREAWGECKIAADICDKSNGRKSLADNA